MTNIKAGERIVPEWEEEKNLGDIIIAPQYVMDDLPRWEQSFEERMRDITVHGICHLLGYDHIDDEDYKVMHAQETLLLQKLAEADRDEKLILPLLIHDYFVVFCIALLIISLIFSLFDSSCLMPSSVGCCNQMYRM